MSLAVDKAYKLLLDGEQKKRAVDVIHAGKEYVEHNVSDPAFTIIHTPQMYVLPTHDSHPQSSPANSPPPPVPKLTTYFKTPSLSHSTPPLWIGVVWVSWRLVNRCGGGGEGDSGEKRVGM